MESLGHFHDFTLDGMDLLLKCALVPVTFSSSQLLKSVSAALALSMLVALLLEVVLLMLLVLGPLRGTHRFALRFLSSLHSEANALILSTMLLAISSLWSHTSCRVLGTACNSSSATLA
jgi:hypothetical protein